MLRFRVLVNGNAMAIGAIEIRNHTTQYGGASVFKNHEDLTEGGIGSQLESLTSIATPFTIQIRPFFE
jgi:hypothetical protein